MEKSQNGYPASRNTAEIGVAMQTVPGTDVQVSVRVDIGNLLLDMAQWWQENVEPLKSGHCHGHNFRFIAGTTVLSNHSSGTAIDLNAPAHPFGSFGTVPAHLRDDITAKAASLGLRWGGNFTGKVDEMHFEVIVPLEEAKRIRDGLGPSQSRPTVRRGARGEVVKELQSILNRKIPDVAHLVVDGIFGPLTEQAVRVFQQREQIGVDGIVGPITWRHLLG